MRFSYIIWVINMKSASVLMKNTILLALSSVIMRLLMLCFQAFLASKAGAEQLGVYGIIASVGIVFSTIGISGVRFGSTRLVAAEISCGNEYPHSLMRCAFLYATFFSVLSGMSLYFLAQPIAALWVNSGEATLPLKIMAFSILPISLGSCIEGYFTAKQKILRVILSETTGMLLRMAFVAVIIIKKPLSDVPSLLSAGFLIGEAVFSLGLFILYFKEIFKKKEKYPRRHTKNLIRTSLPLAVSAYMRTGLSSMGQIIIPMGLRKAGMGVASAFSTYGIITQMSMPVIMFPQALLVSLGEILVPHLTGAQMENRKIGISYIVNRAMRIGIMFSFAVMGVMLFYSKELGELIYKSTEAGLYIKIFAPLVPVIYIDCVTDGCLKGLGQQLPCMIYNVLEGIINVVLLYILLPKVAIIGYILVMYVKEIFNAYLSIRRLKKVTAVEISISTVLSVIVCMLGAYIMTLITMPGGMVIVKILLFTVFYISLLYIINAVTREDIKWAASLVAQTN